MKMAKLVLLITAVLLCVGLLVTAEPDSQGRLVEELELRGYRAVPREEILKRIKTRPGEEYNEKQVLRDFERVLGMNAFDKQQSRVTTREGVRDGVIVIFELKEVPRQR